MQPQREAACGRQQKTRGLLKETSCTSHYYAHEALLFGGTFCYRVATHRRSSQRSGKTRLTLQLKGLSAYDKAAMQDEKDTEQHGWSYSFLRAQHVCGQ
eukprot:3448417-Pyramimonas_sp.AAC.1